MDVTEMIPLNKNFHIVYSYLRIIFRKYRICFFLGLLIIVFQGFSGYYLYSGIDDQLNQGIRAVEETNSNSRSVHFGDIFSKGRTPQIEQISKLNPFLYSKSKKAPYDNSESFEKENFDGRGISFPCNISSKDAISALKRAKTLHCKQVIANISCQIQKGNFYDSRLYSSCPSNGYKTGRYLGCIIDNRENRILVGYAAVLSTNSPEICSDICYQRGFAYCGVEYSKECFCGNKEPPAHFKVPESECDMPCSNNSTRNENCGGYLRVSTFQTGLAKFRSLPLKDPSLNDGRSVRIAYILTVNGRAVRQIHRLFKALYHKDHYFIIHVDSRQHYLYNELLHLETLFSNVVLSRKRFSSIWGGTSLLSVLLHCMKELLMLESWTWDFIINLSESDFPIKPDYELVQFLTANRDRNFLKSHGQNTNKFILKQGLDRTFLECEAHMWRIGDRNLPFGIRYDGGSDWFCLNRQLVEYIIHSKDQLVSGLLKLYSSTLLPAESFFHTVLRNSVFCQTYADNNLHMTNWKRNLGCNCQYKHIVDWCGCSPNDFLVKDWSKIEESKSKHYPLFFARKFESVISLTITNRIEDWMYGSYEPDIPNWNSYWENRYHVDDHHFDGDIDDIGLTLYHATMRLTTSPHMNSWETNSLFRHRGREDCEIVTRKVVQSLSYHVHDRVEGLLVEFQMRPQYSGDDFNVQAWIKPKDLLSFSEGSTSHRLKHVEVNSNFDLKEQVFRNFGKNLGPNSTIVVVTWWLSSDENEPIVTDTFPHIVLVDPNDAVAAHENLTLGISEQVIDNTFYLPSPLLPGIWKAYIIINEVTIATVQFAILPLQFSSGKQLSAAEGSALHGGPKEPYSVSYQDYLMKLSLPLKFYPGNASLVKTSKQNALRSGPELLEWIDDIVHSVNDLKGICYRSSEYVPVCFKRLVAECSTVAWSSYSPDPKSDIGEIDQNTGYQRRPYKLFY